MRYRRNSFTVAVVALLAMLASAGKAMAQAPPSDLGIPPASVGAATSAGQPSSDPMTNLLMLLVQRGVLTRDEAAILQRQAEQQAVGTKAPAADPEGTVRVPYVPEVVKRDIRNEIKKEVLAQAKEENWAAPNAVPSWVQKFRPYGDVRVRAEGIFYPEGNDTSGSFTNFNSINTGNPFDASAANVNFSPQRNVSEDRFRARLRARLGTEIDLSDHFTAGLRIATGESNSPVSTNQSLGAASGQGGQFSKYALWLDRGYLKYEPVKQEKRGFSVSAGRFDNPFFGTTLVWADSLGFDGAVVNTKIKINERESNFLTLGAFPVFNTDLNFTTNQPNQAPTPTSHDKWLFGGQYGTDWQVSEKTGVKLAAAYYHFYNVEGELSSPCTVLSTQDRCDTDATRPTFAQFGNTYRALRNIIADANNGFGATNQLQYYGFASSFQELVLTGRVDIASYDPFHIRFDGEFVKNLGFDKGKIEQVAVNNRDNPNAPFEGGDTGYYLGMTVGARTLEKWGDWTASLAYKYVESDAVLDALTDSDFGLGGTNLKGFILGGNFALSENVWAGLRWMSADSIAGPPFAVDTIQFDISGRF